MTELYGRLGQISAGTGVLEKLVARATKNARITVAAPLCPRLRGEDQMARAAKGGDL